MVSCTEFIPLYSELFKYLEDIGGHNEVVRYWEYISDTYVADLLGKEVESKGLRGCWDYWTKSLNEEACDFRMELDEKNGTFSIDMRYCPSRGRLNGYKHMEPYHDYCGHCALLYARQLEKFDIEMEEFDVSRIDEAKCVLKFRTETKKKNGEKLHMDRRAADNEYFHRDFHISAKRGLEYVGEKYGDEAVCEYLTRFAKAYYALIAEKVKKDGLVALCEHIQGTYDIEKASGNVKCKLSENELTVSVLECPGVRYIKQSDNDPTKWYVELTRTVNKAIADMCGLCFELLSYNEEDGAAQYVFRKLKK